MKEPNELSGQELFDLVATKYPHTNGVDRTIEVSDNREKFYTNVVPKIKKAMSLYGAGVSVRSVMLTHRAKNKVSLLVAFTAPR